MNTAEMIIAGIVVGVFCFVVSFIFFNKVIKLDKSKSTDGEEGSLPLLISKNYGKFWFDEHIKTISKMMEINALLKLIKEEGVISQAEVVGKELKGVDGVNELIQYFIKGSESNKKLFTKVNGNDVSGVEDFTQKSLDYLGYFFSENNLIEPVARAINYEKGITENYASYSKAKKRITDLDLYLLVLKKVEDRCKKREVEAPVNTDTNNACTS